MIREDYPAETGVAVTRILAEAFVGTTVGSVVRTTGVRAMWDGYRLTRGSGVQRAIGGVIHAGVSLGMPFASEAVSRPNYLGRAETIAVAGLLDLGGTVFEAVANVVAGPEAAWQIRLGHTLAAKLVAESSYTIPRAARRLREVLDPPEVVHGDWHVVTRGAPLPPGRRPAAPERPTLMSEAIRQGQSRLQLPVGRR